jgi:hypothetical protein
VRLAFENDQIVDKTFKGVREDLAGKSRRYDGEILNADGYRSSFLGLQTLDVHVAV